MNRKHMMTKKEDTYSYKGWLVSDFIVKRAFAVMGHYMLAGLIVWACMVALVLVLFLGAELLGNFS
jgi:hypothetical protein